MKDQWFQNAIVYSLDVETYMDSDGDGVGDFPGLEGKLDHLSGLGVNCIWMRPFYPSPRADDGYDVMDYYNVDPRFGNIGDFVDFVVKARALGLRIIIDLVVNHTSHKHEWFQKSRRDPESKYRDFYIWRKEKPSGKEQHENMLLEGGIWNYDPVADAYYMHHFLKEQPDLNLSNPEVLQEIKKIMGFWLQLGVSGFRIDAAHIIVHESKGKVFEVLEEFREFINKRNHEAILLAEANVPVEDLQEFFGPEGKSRMHILFNFYTNKNMFLSLVRGSGEPLAQILKEMQGIKGLWLNFLRSHDELNLEMLTKDEQQEVHQELGPHEHMRIFGHGIRRRLPPMLKGHTRKMKLIYSVMFSLPGNPLINYGEEIAMGDDLREEGRSSVRTAMQWDRNKNAGFSDADPDQLAHPVIDFGDYDYHKINVSEQQKDPDSFLNWVERLISTRKHVPQLSFGSWEVLESNHPQVFVYCNIWRQEKVIMLHNFMEKDCEVNIKVDPEEYDRMNEIFNDQRYEDVETIDASIKLAGFGFRWFTSRIKRKGSK
jgi:maltose alpha-D-glucosyltransferase / alpha-amylase